jgi:hypothetical protein
LAFVRTSTAGNLEVQRNVNVRSSVDDLAAHDGHQHFTFGISGRRLRRPMSRSRTVGSASTRARSFPALLRELGGVVSREEPEASLGEFSRRHLRAAA